MRVIGLYPKNSGNTWRTLKLPFFVDAGYMTSILINNGKIDFKLIPYIQGCIPSPSKID